VLARRTQRASGRLWRVVETEPSLVNHRDASAYPRAVLPSVTRRLALGGAFGAATTLLARHAAAQVHVDISRGDFQPMPIAIPEFIPLTADDVDTARAITQIIAANLHRSGFFLPIDPAALTQKITALDVRPNFQSWRITNAQALIVGRVFRQPDGLFKAEFRLWDILSGQLLGNDRSYVTPPENWRRLAHISDTVYERITGEKGYFDSRVAFVDEAGPKERRIKRLAMMDQDGANVRYLTRGEELVLTPRFSPTGPNITYMTYGASDPHVYLLNIISGQADLVGNFPGMTFSPRFSPTGRNVIFSLGDGSNASIFVMELASRKTTRLTNTEAIDTAPCYSPDGSQICFESDRGGQPQIYVMSAAGGPAQRISFGTGIYSTPVWSPLGDFIAFTKQSGGNFAIGMMRPNGSGERVLTEGFHYEGPTFAPNGRVVMFFSEPMGAPGPSLFTIDTSGRNETRVPTPSYASDPAWSPPSI
jgi:TolB protein